MTLNIKDPEAHKLARRIAQQTGESMTRAVTEALRERLSRLNNSRKSKGTAEDLLAIGRRCAATLKHRGRRKKMQRARYFPIRIFQPHSLGQQRRCALPRGGLLSRAPLAGQLERVADKEIGCR